MKIDNMKEKLQIATKDLIEMATNCGTVDCAKCSSSRTCHSYFPETSPAGFLIGFSLMYRSEVGKED